MKKITFIIVTWNNEDIIIDCLDSIYKYSNNFSIIVVDNNSSDDTVKFIKKNKYKDCKIIESKENLGFAKGNNLGLEYVDTEYICYLNPDTILLEDIVEPSIEVLKSKQDIGIVGCKLLYKNMKLQSSTFNFDTSKQILMENLKICKIFPNFIKEKYYPYYSKSKKNKYVDWVIGAEMILKTSDAKRINGFSEDYYMYIEDMDLCKKISILLNKKCYYLANHSLIHIGGASESKNINYDKMKLLIRNKFLFIKKYYGIKELSKAYRTFKFVYKLRFYFTYLIKPFSKSKFKYYNEKMKKGYLYVQECYKEIKE